MLLPGSDIIIECLLEQGVDTVFGYPGGAVLNIYDSLYMYSDKIRHVITAHEQAACHAADGYSRTTGRTGVVIATSGPGATNLVTGIATAYMDSIPLIAITGNVTTNLLGLDSFQEVDICGITMPVVKHNYIVKDVTKLADTIREAFYIANSGRKGPVLIDIPKDITIAKTEYEKQTPKPIVNHNPDDINEQIDVALEVIKNAERPYIYAGGGVVIKFHADKAYTTCALSAAAIEEIFRNADVPFQKFYNRSDVRSGSTLGSISLSKVSLLSADIGIAQFAMHSACESFAIADYASMRSGIRAFFASSIQVSGDEIIIG